MKEPITLRIQGREYSYWDSADIVSEAYNICRAFTVGMTVKAPGMGAFFDTFKPGQACEVLIGGDLVCTGYIDQAPVNYTATSMQAQIIGHSKTIDLIDCTVAKSGMSIKALTGANNARWSVPKPPVPDGFTLIPSPSDITAVSWNNVKIYSIIAHLIAPYGVRLLVNNDVLSNNISKNFNVDIEKKVIDVIKEMVEEHNLWVTDNEYGDLVISKQADGEAVEGLKLGGNVLSGSSAHNATKLFTMSDVAGTVPGDKTKSGRSVTQICGSAELTQMGKKLTGLTRFRYKRVKNDKADAKKCSTQASSEMNYELGQFMKASYSVQGWRQRPYKSSGTGKNPLWRVNDNVTVVDPVLFGTEAPSPKRVVSKVEFVLDLNGGMITNLEVVPPYGYKNPKTGNDKTETKPSETKAGFANKHQGEMITVISSDGTEKAVV